MEAELLGSEMVRVLVVQPPAFSLFFVFNLFAFLIVGVVCVIRFAVNGFVIARLSFCFTVFVCLIYQAPLVIFSQQAASALRNPWIYSLVLNGSALLLAYWGVLSRRLDFTGLSSYPEKTNGIYLATGILAVGLLWIYLSGVPWACTGLYALLFDPLFTLLARELSVKLIGTSIYTYSLGAYAGAIAPIFILLSVWRIREAILCRNVLYALVGALFGLVAIVVLLISGTKGLLLPTLLMLVTGAYFWCKTWLSRFLTIAFSILFVFFSLIAFEILKERGSIVGEGYDFAACSVQTGTCEESHGLLESMKEREDSLGLPRSYIEPTQSRLTCLCNREGNYVTCPLGTLARAKVVMPKPEASVGVRAVRTIAQRAGDYTNSVFNRIFVVPFQVSIWNFMYAETESVDGLKTLPFARRIFGNSLNIPELVYQKYGSVYSVGDRTSTSTAPTSFFLAYPAYVGWIGFCISLAGIVILDLFLAMFASFIGASLIPVLCGVVMILSMNFMTSDFVTVLVSHGGAAGILVLSVHAFLSKRRK